LKPFDLTIEGQLIIATQCGDIQIVGEGRVVVVYLPNRASIWLLYRQWHRIPTLLWQSCRRSMPIVDVQMRFVFWGHTVAVWHNLPPLVFRGSGKRRVQWYLWALLLAFLSKGDRSNQRYLQS
jgi:hypothetical protein